MIDANSVKLSGREGEAGVGDGWRGVRQGRGREAVVGARSRRVLLWLGFLCFYDYCKWGKLAAVLPLGDIS